MISSGRTSSRKLLLAASWLLTANVPVRAALEPAGQEKVRSWLKQELLAAKSLPAQPLHLSWTQQDVYAPPKSQIDEWEKAIKLHPDHPIKSRFDQWKRQANGHPSIMSWQLWWQTYDVFRINSTHDDLKVFIDQTRFKNVNWNLRTDALVVLPSSDAMSNPATVLPKFEFDVCNFLYSGLWDVAQRGMSQPVISQLPNNELWRALFSGTNPNDEPKFEYIIRWDNTHDRGFVTSKRIIVSVPENAPLGPTEDVPYEYRFSDYKYDPETARWLAAEVDGYNHAGIACMKYSLRSIEPLTREEFERVAAIPSATSPDPIRGWNSSNLTETGSGDSVLVGSSHRALMPSWVPYLGYASVVAVAGLAVWLVRRKQFRG